MHKNLDFVVYRLLSNEFLINGESVIKNVDDLLMIPNVFRFIHKNFEKLNREISIAEVLPVLHHSLSLKLKNECSLDIGSYVSALLNLNANSETGLHCCLQILYQILETLSAKEEKFLYIGDESFHILIKILLENQFKKINVNMIICIKLYVRKFESLQMIKHLWNSIRNYINGDQLSNNMGALEILIHFYHEFTFQISDFKQSIEVDALVQHFLNSEQHYERKFAYFLLREAYPYMDGEKTQLDGSTAKEQDARRKSNFWRICIECFEKLEESESGHVLASLEKLKDLRISDLQEQIWLDMLYRQILRHSNKSVRRWIVEYLLGKLTYFSITKPTQIRFMQALNDLDIYNIEESLLPADNIGKFLICEKSSFLQTFSEIKWKAAPLHYWLTQLRTHWQTLGAFDITNTALIEIARKISEMSNVILRRENIRLFKEIFAKIIAEMELKEYCQLIEELYSDMDPFEIVDVLTSKLNDCMQSKMDGNDIFTMRLCHVLQNCCELQWRGVSYLFYDLVLNTLEKIQRYQWTPGSLRFLFIHFLDTFDIKMFIESYYGIDASNHLYSVPPKTLYLRFKQTFASNDEEAHMLRQSITGFYTRNFINSFSDLRKHNLSLEDLLTDGSSLTLCCLSETLAESSEVVDPVLHVFDSLVTHLRKHLSNDHVTRFVCENLMKYCCNNLISSESVHWGLVLLSLDLESLEILHTVTYYVDGSLFPDDFLIKGTILGEAKSGESRAEEAYECNVTRNLPKLQLIRMKYIQLISNINQDERKASILETLCKMLRYKNQQNPGYDLYSVEHRMLMRILFVVMAILKNSNFKTEMAFSELWGFLMEHQNQENVMIMCEIIIASMASWEMILAKIQTQIRNTEVSTPYQELSMISLLNRSFILKCGFNKSSELEKLLYLLWSFIFSSHSQVQLCAQLTISALLEGFQKENSENRKKLNLLEHFLKLKSAVRRPLNNEQIIEFRNDIRFMKLNIEDALENVMAFTNAPYDEYNFIQYPPLEIETTKIDLDPNSSRNIEVNDEWKTTIPGINKTSTQDLVAFPDSLHVVASLIEKEEVLEAIANTCGILGIQNFVSATTCLSIIDPRLHTRIVQPTELTEYILQKKSEGFQIIGAGKASKTCTLENFSFPRRSVLLLGHEETAIPLYLKGYLDFLVDLSPTNVSSPSLNMHEGTLLIYEYCRQLLIGYK